jgi:RHS repeat-associated protein
MPLGEDTGPTCTGTAMTLNTVYDYGIGRPTSTTDPNNKTTTYAYSDPLDRPTQITPPISGASTAFTYNDTPGALSESSTVTQTNGNPIRTEADFDGLGRKTHSIRYSACASSGDVHQDTTYDARGRVYQVSTPYCPGDAINYSTTLYDGMSRPTSVSLPTGALTTTTYGVTSLGQTATVSAAAMVAGSAGTMKRQSTTDALGRLVQVIEDPTGLAYPTTYSYNALDDLTAVNQSGLTRSFAYDSLKRLRQATNPESGTITYAYDQSGNLATKVDARNITTTLSYDPLNRILSKTYSSGGTVSYAYDNAQSGCNGLARLASVTYSASVTNYSCYDAVGHVTASSQTTGTTTYPFQYTWDLSGALHSETYPSGRTLTNTYDAAGQIGLLQGTLAGNTTNYASNIVYAAQGALKSLSLNNGLTETWTFDAKSLQPTQLVASGANASLTLGWNYGADAYNNGNILSATIAGNGLSATQSFTYDPLSRLATSAEGSAWSRSYGYDAFGNGWVTANTGLNLDPTTPTASSNFTSQNRLNVDNSNYDAAGNQTAIAGFTNVYDAESRLATSTISGVTTTYTYDGDGHRVQKANGSTTTVYVYDAAGQLAAEYGPPSSAPCATCYLTADTLGSTRMLTDATGTVKSLHDYLPFGEEINSGVNGRTSTWGTAYPTQKFTGKERDSETGLDYFGARYLSSAQERFTSPDAVFADQHPADPQSWNLYSYVGNNPLHYVDPTGRGKTLDILRGIAKGAGSFVANSCPGYVAVKQVVAAVNDMRNPGAAQARTQATIDTVKSLGTADGRKAVAASVANSWNSMSTTDKASAATQMALTVATAVAGGYAASGSTTTSVTHFTNDAGVGLITDAGGVLRGGGQATGTFVAPTSEIPTGATGSQVEQLLEIAPGKGANSITFETTNSNLVTPANGPTTSGEVTQFQLKEPVQIDPTKFKKTN